MAPSLYGIVDFGRNISPWYSDMSFPDAKGKRVFLLFDNLVFMQSSIHVYVILLTAASHGH